MKNQTKWKIRAARSLSRFVRVQRGKAMRTPLAQQRIKLLKLLASR